MQTKILTSSLSCICTSRLGKSGIRQGCNCSHSNEQMDKMTLEIVKTGDHWDIRITRQMLPLLLTYEWQILLVNVTLGYVKG